jgi:Baseplate J-like protein
MHVLDEPPQETIHLYVLPEDQLPQKPDYPSIMVAVIAFLCLLTILGIALYSAAPAEQEVSFTLTVPGFHLAPVSKTLKTTVIATGKGHTPATVASGMITFYNGAIYTQIIPVGTILKGSDGVSVITDQQAIIPPAAQTTPPTYGHTSVAAHALVPGAEGNIHAGDINQACCVTSVLAQNPYSFTRGTDARIFTYLTKQDVHKTLSSLLPTLQAATLSFLPNPRLHSSCSTTTVSSPSIGKETASASLTIIETCQADSYSEQSVAQAITTYSTHFGKGMLTSVQFFVVGSTEKKGVILTLYVVGRWTPFFPRRFPTTGK